MHALNLVHLNGLRAAEAAHRLGSLQAVADEFGVSVGAVSQQIIKTERQLGLTLFERTPRGLVATEQGRPVLALLASGFRQLAEAASLAGRRDPSTLTISVAPVFASRWLVHRIDRFAARHPGIRLRIDASSEIVDLATSGIDLAIRVGAGHWPGVESQLVLPQLVFPVASPALARSIRTPADLARVPVVVDERAMFSWADWLAAAGVPDMALAVRHRFNEASLCLDAVMAGQGVMLAWQTLAVDAVAAGRLAVPIAIRVPTGFGHHVVHPAGRRPGAAARAFTDWLKEELSASIAGLEPLFSPH